MDQITVEDLRDEKKRGRIPLGDLSGLPVAYHCVTWDRRRTGHIHAVGREKVWIELPPRAQGDKPWVETCSWQRILEVFPR